MSINWDGWAFNGDLGNGRLALTRSEGMDVFRRLLSLPLAVFPAQVAVSTGDLNQRIDQWIRLSSVRAKPTAAQETPVMATHQRPVLDDEYEAPVDEVERFVSQLWQSLLGIDQIGRHDNFFQLGGHSLLAVQAASRLRDAFRVDVSVHALFEAPTVSRLAEVISDSLAAAKPTEGLAEILAQVESLSDEEIAALLAKPSDAPRPVTEGQLFATNLAHHFNSGRATNKSTKAAIQLFYDTINGRLDAGVAGEYAFFLNYGYIADGRSEMAIHKLPERALNRNSTQLVLEAVGDCELAGRRVLDVGCGRGGTISVLHRFFSPSQIVGIDLSALAIQFCRRVHNYPGVRFVCGDAEHLPFADESFDAVINIESSHSYPNVAAFYAGVYRVLVPGGVFLYADTVASGEASSRLEMLTRQGFRVELARDITSNVVRSCDELAEKNAKAFATGITPEVLDDFLAVPGSDNYNSLCSGRLLYGIWRLRKS